MKPSFVARVFMETVLKIAQSIPSFVFAMAIGLALGAISSAHVTTARPMHPTVAASSFGEMRIKGAYLGRSDVFKGCGGRHVC